MNLVMDSSAIIALFRREEGAELVQALMDDPSNATFMHAANLCEVYYGFRRERGEAAGHQMVEVVRSMALRLREDLDVEFWIAAGRYKADLRRLSLADCFCIALAERIGGEVVTSDRHEIGAVVDQIRCPIRFIR